VAKRYPREKFLLTNKLTTPYFNKQEDIRPFVESQLKLCGVDYFDFYLMHAQDRNNYQKYKRCQAYETCYALKQEGLRDLPQPGPDPLHGLPVLYRGKLMSQGDSNPGSVCGQECP